MASYDLGPNADTSFLVQTSTSFPPLSFGHCACPVLRWHQHLFSALIALRNFFEVLSKTTKGVLHETPTSWKCGFIELLSGSASQSKQGVLAFKCPCP